MTMKQTNAKRKIGELQNFIVRIILCSALLTIPSKMAISSTLYSTWLMTPVRV